MTIIYIPIIGLLLDMVMGEPPAIIHPVVWMGKIIALLIKIGGAWSSAMQFLWGLIVSIVVISIFVIPAYFLLIYLRDFNVYIYVLVSAVIFKISFSLKGLLRAGTKIRDLLNKNNQADARFELRALVGRDTNRLEEKQIVSAAVESVAENACDSFLAPFFFFIFLGIPGAIGYRVINTLDAMIGRHGQYEYLGKFAARLDTVANFIPARITALAIVGASWICRQKASHAWSIMLRDRNKTESPNAGWTMGAMAGALDIQLEKIGFYKLGDNRDVISVKKIDDSLRIVLVAVNIWILIIVLAEVIYHVAT
jgi:adenosylcobinamide-phosphate synthase